MQTCQSPQRVLIVAYRLARRTLPGHACKFSRQDFTLAQLFACLVLREFFHLSFRRAEALLVDSPQWLAAIGMSKAPDHNTLWRAFDALLASQRCRRMLDLLARLFAQAKVLTVQTDPLAADSTCYEEHHRSRHDERRCRRMMQAALRDRVAVGSAKNPVNTRLKWGRGPNADRSGRMRCMPKLAIAVDSGCHLILAAKTRLGNGSDAPDFGELLDDACRRAGTRVKVVVADAGYDSETNHWIAREQLGVRSIIPPDVGRPTSKPPQGRWRRLMAKRFKRKADEKAYGQRAQSETVHSMMKRNLGSALRSRTPERRKKEMMLRVLVHNITLLCDQIKD
jgi:hypothetical protein